MSSAKSSQIAARPGDIPRTASLAFFVCVAYYLGSRVGFALTFQPHPISALWPANSILLAGLLLAPMRSWWIILFAALPAHFAAELQGGVPNAMIVAWFMSNCSEALIGAYAIRSFVKGPLRFDRLPHVAVFIVCAAFLGPFISTFLDTGLVKLIGWGEGAYWELWRMRFFSNSLAALTIVPVIVMWGTSGIAPLLPPPLHRHLEAAAITVGLVVVSYIAFGSHDKSWTAAPLMLYAPAPFLLWAALRFGPLGSSTAFLMVVFVAIWGAIHGHGPFIGGSAQASAFSVQFFLSGLAIAFLLVSALIVEKETAQDALREKQEQLELALGAGQIGTWEWDEASPGTTFMSTVHASDRRRVLDAITRAVDTVGSFELEHRVVRPDGAVRWVLGKGRTLNDRTGRHRLVGVNVDVTELREAREAVRAEEAVRLSEAHFHQLADTMPHMVWAARPHGTVDYCNQRWYEIAGQTALPMTSDGWRKYLHPDDFSAYLGAWHLSIATGRLLEAECRFLFMERGEYRWQLARALPVRGESGNIERWYGSMTDIHDRKRVEQMLRSEGALLEDKVEERTVELLSANQALIEEIGERNRVEDALRASEQQFSKAFHGSPDAMVIVRRANGAIVEVNDRWQAIFGFTHAEAVGSTLADLGVFPTLVAHDSVLQACCRGTVRDLEVSLRTRRGATLKALVAADLIEMGGEHCLIAILRDMTEQRRVEDEAREQRTQLTHLTRVAILGELTGALAHELNQPLTAILANAQATQRLLERTPIDLQEVRESIKDIIDQDKRAGEVIRRLRTLLKRGEAQHQRLDINEVVREAIDLAHGDLVNRAIALRTHLGEAIPLVNGDRVQLEQVLLNLIVNACEEMAEMPNALRHLEVASRPTKDGSVIVSVADSGPGIPRDRLDLLFEPFYTTKEKGLGLGLSISRSIANAHGGNLWAESSRVGAVFYLELPPAKERQP